MAQTTAREALNCLGFSYFAKKGSKANIQEFSSIVHEFYFNDDKSVLTPYKQNLASTFNFQRIRELYKAGESEALKAAGSDYPKRVYEKDFPQGKSHMAEGGLATKLDTEIKSAYLTAEAVKKSAVVASLSQYIFYDQSTDFMKTVNYSVKQIFDGENFLFTKDTI